MSYKVSNQIGLGNSTPIKNLKIHSSDSSKTALGRSLQSPLSNPESVASDAARISRLPLADNAQRFAEKNSEAVSAITEIRSKQLDLANLAAATSDSRKQSEYGEEIDSLQTEIERISSEATFTGKNALAGGGISITDDENNYQRVVQVADFRTLSSDPGINTQNQVDASASVTLLEQSLSSSRTAQTGSSASLSNAEQIAEESISVKKRPEQTITSIDEASALAEKVAREIRDKFNPGELDESVIAATLDPGRVKDLLS